jgi:hypothetical protein
VSALILLLFVVTLVTATAVLQARRPADRSNAWPDGLNATARTTTRWRLVGLVVGLGAGLAVTALDVLGRGLLLAAPVGALCVLGGVVVGELRIARPLGPVRSAGLEVRRVRDYLPSALTRGVAGASALLGLLLVATSLAGSPDDMGRAGRTLARQCSALVSQAVGPWPGSFYSLPLAAVVLSGLLLAAFALRRVVHRPRSGEDRSADDALRRRAAEAVTAGVGLLVAVPLAGVSAFAAHALANVGCAPTSWRVAAGALGLLVPALAVLAAWCVVVLITPTGRQPAAHEPVAP